MSHVIRFVAMAGGITTGSEMAAQGDYLKSYDPDGGPPNAASTGVVEWTSDPAEALLFDSALEAMLTYRRQSERKPLRADGKPNCPLTAVTVSIEPL